MPPAPRRFFWDVKMKRTEGERDIELCLKKGRKKKKTRNKTKPCSLSAVVVCPADMMSTVLS